MNTNGKKRAASVVVSGVFSSDAIEAGRRVPARALIVLLCALLMASWSSPAQQSLSFSSDPTDGGTVLQSGGNGSVWQNSVGEGFRRGAQSVTVSAGATYGLTALGSKESHDLLLGSLTYGLMLDNTIGQGKFYGGNFEFRLELLNGLQISPRSDWVVALSPHLRYNLETGTRWIPFIDGGAGVAATSIREPDLGGTWQFDLQAAVGVQRFLTENMALTFQAGYLHMSSAGLYKANLGVNCVSGMAGVSFFF